MGNDGDGEGGDRRERGRSPFKALLKVFKRLLKAFLQVSYRNPLRGCSHVDGRRLPPGTGRCESAEEGDEVWLALWHVAQPGESVLTLLKRFDGAGEAVRKLCYSSVFVPSLTSCRAACS